MSGHVTIRRIRSEYQVERETADPSRVRSACDAVLRQHLPQVLRSALGRWCDADDESIWLVRRLDIDLAVNTEWKSDALARAFTARITRALATVLTGEGDGVDAIHFSGPAAYLARFLADAATGDAWSRWYYARFDGLRMLPTSAALRAALVADARLGLAAMQRLSGTELARVIGAMSERDRAVVIDRFAGEPFEGDPGTLIDGVWSAWRQHAGEYPDASARVLALFVRAHGPGCGGVALRAAIEALGAAGELTQTELRTLVASLRRGAPAPVLKHAPPSLRAAPLELIERLLASRDETRALDFGTTAATRFGGVFFLLPQLDGLPLEEWLASWPVPQGAAAGSALRLLTAAKCMGGPRAGAAFSDPVPRRLFRVEPDFTLAAARDWLRKAGPKRRHQLLRAANSAADAEGVELHATREELAQLALPRRAGVTRAWDGALAAVAQLVLRQFARRLPGFSESGFAYLLRNFLDVAATLEEEPERLVARVARPPLHLVLNLTGMNRTSYALRGEARPVAVFSQE